VNSLTVGSICSPVKSSGCGKELGASQAPGTCPAPLKTGAKCIELSCSALVARLSGRVRLRIETLQQHSAHQNQGDLHGRAEHAARLREHCRREGRPELHGQGRQQDETREPR
jgi:hypothetical protein